MESQLGCEDRALALVKTLGTDLPPGGEWALAANATPHVHKVIQTYLAAHRCPTSGALWSWMLAPTFFPSPWRQLAQGTKERLGVGSAPYSHSFQRQVRAEVLNLAFPILAEHAPLKAEPHLGLSLHPLFGGGGVNIGVGTWMAFFQSFCVFLCTQ